MAKRRQDSPASSRYSPKSTNEVDPDARTRHRWPDFRRRPVGRRGPAQRPARRKRCCAARSKAARTPIAAGRSLPTNCRRRSTGPAPAARIKGMDRDAAVSRFGRRRRGGGLPLVLPRAGGRPAAAAVRAGAVLDVPLADGDPLRPLVRCYSLSERPREDFYRVTVKRVTAPRRPTGDWPPGRGSGYFHREVRPGSQLEVEAPQGAFFLDPTDDAPVVLVGGGIGVTPIVSMAAALVHAGDRAAGVLVRRLSQQPRASVSRAAGGVGGRRGANLQLDVSYSRPLAERSAGLDYDHRGRVDAARLRQRAAVEQLSLLPVRAGGDDGVARAGAAGLGRAGGRTFTTKRSARRACADCSGRAVGAVRRAVCPVGRVAALDRRARRRCWSWRSRAACGWNRAAAREAAGSAA